MQNENGYPLQAYGPEPRKKKSGKIVLAVILLAVLIAAYVVISALRTRSSTGILQYSASSANAVISAESSGHESRELGTGNGKVRLKPGNYQIIAVDGAKKTTASVNIVKQRQTSVDLPLQEPTTPTVVTTDAAQDILPANGQLYYLNSSQQSLNSYHPGADNALTYLTKVPPVSDIFWLTPKTFYANFNNTWKYYDGSLHNLNLEGVKPIAASASFTKDGMAAFVTADRRVAVMTAPGAAARAVGTVDNHTNIQTSIAPNGDIIVSTPATSYGDTTAATVLYQKDQTTTFPKDLEGIGNVAWAPDSRKFTYTTNDGMYLYNLDTKRVTTVLSLNPTNPVSATWQSSTTFLYIQNSSIMQYQTSKNISVKLARLDGILNSSRPFSVAPDGETYYYGSLTDGSGSGNKIYSFLPNYRTLSAGKIQSLQQAQKQQVDSVAEDRFLKQLPYIGPGFSFYVSYSLNQNDSDHKATITITAPTVQAQQDATEWMRNAGANLNRYVIKKVLGPVSF